MSVRQYAWLGEENKGSPGGASAAGQAEGEVALDFAYMSRCVAVRRGEDPTGVGMGGHR